MSTGGCTDQRKEAEAVSRPEPYQVLPDLPPEQYEALKADIAKHGFLVAVEIDEYGNILDGHHRARVCRELGINDYPTIVRSGLSEADKRIHARKVNLLRRHLSREQARQVLAEQTKETPNWSNNRIAAALGVDDKTVASMRASMEATSEIPKLEKLIGADGKERRNRPRPARRRKGDDDDAEWTEFFESFGPKHPQGIDALPDEVKIALFKAGISADSVVVMEGSPFDYSFEDEKDQRERHIFLLFLVRALGWPMEAAGRS
jgi:hypothetical protein